MHSRTLSKTEKDSGARLPDVWRPRHWKRGKMRTHITYTCEHDWREIRVLLGSKSK